MTIFFEQILITGRANSTGKPKNKGLGTLKVPRVLAGKPKLSLFLVHWDYLQHFLYNIDNDKSKQKYKQSHSSYKIETSHFLLGKFLSYLNWEGSVKWALYIYGLANTLVPFLGSKFSKVFLLGANYSDTSSASKMSFIGFVAI